MAQLVKQGDIFGRVGTGIGRGLAEQLPKEAERYRLSTALENLGKQKDLTPFQQFTGLVGAASDYPQVVQTGGDVLRQQSIINSIKKGNEPVLERPQQNTQRVDPYAQNAERPSSPTTIASTKARQEPYIPPTAQQREALAVDKMSNEPQKYRTIEEARSAVDRDVAAETERSDAQINKGELERNIGTIAGNKFANQIKLSGANIPPILQERLQNEVIGNVTDGVMSEDDAVKEASRQATEMSKNFANLHSLGGITAALQDHGDLFKSLRNYKDRADEGKYKPEAADQMVKSLEVTPRFAYAQMYPVKEVPELNREFKTIPPIKKGQVPLSGNLRENPELEHSVRETQKVMGRLAAAMGNKGSPLSIAYELDKRGYDGSIFLRYVQNHRKLLNLTLEQDNELGKTQPSFWGRMNDLFLREATGVQ